MNERNLPNKISPLKVMFLVDHLGVGGVQEFILNYVRKMGHKVTVVGIFRGDFYADRLRSAGAEVVQITNSVYGRSAVVNPLNLMAFRRFVSENLHKYDVIQVRLFAAFFYTSLLGLYKRDNVYASIDATPKQISLYILTIYRHYARRYRWFLLPAMYADEFRSLRLRKCRRVRRVYFVTDHKEAEPYQFLSKYNFISVGRCIKQKGHHDAILFFQTLRPCLGQSSSLSIIGDGPGLEDLKRSAGSDPDIHFLGSVPSIGSYLNGCTAVLKFAIGEGENSVVREAALVGKPVVATRETANCDMLVECAFILPTPRRFTVADVRKIAELLISFEASKSSAVREAAEYVWGDAAVKAAWDVYPVEAASCGVLRQSLRMDRGKVGPVGGSAVSRALRICLNFSSRGRGMK